MSADIDGEAENQENLDNDADQETTGQQKKTEKTSGAKTKDEIDDEYKEYKTSRELFEECLQESFYETGKQELISIISNKFPRLGRKISSHYEIDTLIKIFIDYCASHGEFKVAWSVIKEKRPTWYNDFFPRWRLAVQQEEHIEYGYKKRQRKQPKQEDIVDWFFKLDDPVAQSMVITAALFQGIEKSTFNELTQDIHKRLFPPEQKVQMNEQLSSEENKEDSEQQKETQVPPLRLKNEYEQFQMAKLKFIPDKRNSDYGLTDVEIVIFEFNNYQTEILKLIKNNLYSKQSDLFEFIKSLVDDGSAEKRLFAVKAVIALSETHLFQDLLGRIIKTWAKTKNDYTHQATALTLSGILLQGRLENEILALLNSWLKAGSSIFLNITSMFTYYLIADKYPEQALQAVAHASDKENDIFLRKSLDIAFRVYRYQRPKFIIHLCAWINNDKPELCLLGGRYFSRFITLDDVVEDQTSRKKVVEIISILWKSRTIPQRLKMQQETTEKIREWAEEALLTLERNEKETFLKHQTLFHELYRECGEKIDYYFNKWQEYREYKQQRAVERGASNESLLAARQVSFFLLIPTKE